MPLHKNTKSLRNSQFTSPFLNKKLKCKKSLAISFLIPAQKEETSPPYSFSSPSPADYSNKIANFPKKSASLEIKKAALKNVKQGEQVFGNRLEEKAHIPRNREKLVKNSDKNKTDKKLNVDTLKESSNLTASQRYLLLEKTVKPSPPENASKREHLEWLQNERYVGLYVQCDNCDKFRYLADVKDPTELPEKWYCFMNKDSAYNMCSAPEVKLSACEEKDMIFNDYNAGSVVWAKLPTYPWWPAMVDDDPDIEQYFWLESYSDFPTHYNVTFFDSELVSRSWITPKFMKPFKGNENMFSLKKTRLELKFLERFNVAKRQAIQALTYTVLDRLRKFSFIARWPYEIGSSPSDKKKRQKGNKKTKTKEYNKRNVNKIKNGITKNVENKKENNVEDTIFYTDLQDEMDWEKMMNKEIVSSVMKSRIPISYSPDIFFDIDSL